MRKSKREAARTRERIVTAAAAEFREHGIAATGLADLMSAAGLTHGGFYRHFDSKDQLIKEACAEAIAAMTDRLASVASQRSGRAGLKAATTAYLSTQHRDNPRDGCPLAALGSELARADAQTRSAATAGFLKTVDVLAGQFDQAKPSEARKRAIAAASTLIGALTMARIVNDEALSASILRSAIESCNATH
jgi:TetR/AcrR family transcriptional repressor of nem operon